MSSSTYEIFLPDSKVVDEAVGGEDFSSLKSNVLKAVKLSVVSLASIWMVKTFGLNLVLLLCFSVVLGDLATFVASENYTLDRRFEFTLLLLNTVSWIIPPLGLFVAGSTFSIASVGIEDKKRASFYKLVSLAAVVNSVAFLTILQYLG